VDGFFDAQWLNLRAITQGSAFWGPHDDRPHFRGQMSQKPSKLGMNIHCRACQLRVNEDCVIEE